MKQTAVEWQFEQLFNSFEKFNNGGYTFNEYLKRNLEIFEQAKELEKQQNSYSEEDMIATFHYGHQVGMSNILAIQSQHSPQPMPKPDLDVLKKEWLEQFKKK